MIYIDYMLYIASLLYTYVVYIYIYISIYIFSGTEGCLEFRVLRLP